MGGFEFRDRSVTLELRGHTFQIEVDTALGDQLMEIGPRITQNGADYVSGKKTKEQCIAEMQADVDSILGEGAADKLLAGRPERCRLDDLVDIAVYIVKVVGEENEKRLAGIGQNRAERRKAARKKA